MNEVLKRCASYGYGTYSRVVITTCVQNMWEEGMQYDDPEEVIRRLTAEVTYINTYLQTFDKSACRRLICRFIFFFGADFTYIFIRFAVPFYHVDSLVMKNMTNA